MHIYVCLYAGAPVLKEKRGRGGRQWELRRSECRIGKRAEGAMEGEGFVYSPRQCVAIICLFSFESVHFIWCVHVLCI